MWVNLPWYRIPLSGAFFSLAYWTKHCLVAQDEAEWWLFLPLIVSAAIIKHSNQYMTFLWYSELLLLIGYLHCVNNRWNIEKKSLEAFDPKWSLFGIYAFNSWLGWLDPTGNVLVFQQNFDFFTLYVNEELSTLSSTARILLQSVLVQILHIKSLLMQFVGQNKIGHWSFFFLQKRLCWIDLNEQLVSGKC